MAIAYTGQLVWTGDTGFPTNHKTFTRVHEVNTVILLRDFALDLKDHSICNFSYRSHTRTDSSLVNPPGVGANVDRKAIIYFRDPDTLEVLHFSYPDPIAADIEETAYGNRIKQSAVIAVVSYLSTATGNSYIPLYGVFTQRR